MASPTINYLQQVQTYNSDAQLPGFLNQNCFISDICNHEYTDFDKKIPANLGDTIGVSLPMSTVANAGLVVSAQPIRQNIAHLSVIGAANVAVAVTNQQRIFNMDKDGFWKATGKGMVSELGSKVEQAIAQHVNSSATDMRSDSATYGQPQYLSGPTRFVDYTATGLLSYQALDQSMSDFISMGAPSDDHCMVLPTNYYSPIIGSGLSQFVPTRNDEIAQSWLVGEFGSPRTKYYRSNYLPIQTAGYLGENGTTLTVVSTNDPTGANVTSITFSGAGSHIGAVKAGDLGYFLSTANINALTFYGHMPTNQPVQFRAIADADSSSNVTVQIITNTHTEGQGLCSVAGNALQNISGPILAGMQAKFIKSHRCGLRVCGKAFYVAIPRLDDERPFDTSVDTDEETKVSLRMYYGAVFGQNQKWLVNDVIWGALLLSRYSQRICLPLAGNVAST
jgi:hypothetical protein